MKYCEIELIVNSNDLYEEIGKLPENTLLTKEDIENIFYKILKKS